MSPWAIGMALVNSPTSSTKQLRNFLCSEMERLLNLTVVLLALEIEMMTGTVLATVTGRPPAATE